jgi:hypothetical protein
MPPYVPPYGMLPYLPSAPKVSRPKRSQGWELYLLLYLRSSALLTFASCVCNADASGGTGGGGGGGGGGGWLQEWLSSYGNYYKYTDVY